MSRKWKRTPQKQGPGKVDMKLELVAIPVSDVDRAKRFYAGPGWRLDADFVVGDRFWVVQFTPPGAPASILFGQMNSTAEAGNRLLPIHSSARCRDVFQGFLAGVKPSLAAMRTRSARESASILSIAFPRCAFTVISLISSL